MRKFGGIALGVALWLGAGGALLARAYDASDPAPFIRLAFVVLPIALLARAWGLVGAPTRAARAGRAAISAQAALAASFLVLESVDPRLLAGFGL
jgi:hypothetical protein